MERTIIKVDLERKTFSVNNESELKLEDSLIGTTVYLGKIHSEKIIPGVLIEEIKMKVAELTLHYHFGDNYTNQMILDEGDKIGNYLLQRNLIHPLYTFLSESKKLEVEIFGPDKENGDPYIIITGYMKPTIQT